MPTGDPATAPPRILLIGMMGAGKSTIGDALAARTGWVHLDNDELVARAAGRPTPQVLADSDEATLRSVERAALDEALDAPAPVIGGVAAGVVLDPAARSLMTEGAFVVYLRAPLALLADRVGDGAGRPWLGQDSRAALERLWSGREALYCGVASLVLDVEGRSPESLADQIIAALGPAT